MPVVCGEATERLVRLRSQQGRAGVTVVRELYLREDIPCYSPLCRGRCHQWRGDGAALLPADATHYLVPDCQVVCDYLEVLELPELTNFIFTHTVLQAVQQDGGRRHYRRLQGFLRNPSKQAFTFHNDFQRDAYCKRNPGEALGKWQARTLFKATEWYVKHLASQVPVIMITTNPQVVSEYGACTVGAHVMTITDYLHSFWPDLTSAHQLCCSLSMALSEKTDKGSQDFVSYLPAEVLQAGLKTGQYVRGRLNVNKHNAQHEAWLRPSGTGGKKVEQGEDILIAGALHRNRTVHGDLVAVELLPRQLWRSRSSALVDNEQGTEADGDEEDDGREAMPTGRVVAVLQRGWRDYVASFDQNQETGQRKADRVLVIPMDWRIPKVRIMTSQAEALKNQRILVRIDSWEPSSQYPNGHFVRSLGVAGELETEIACLLLENSIAVSPFSQALMSEMPLNTEESPWAMDPEEIARRRDLRESHLIFSIDPKGCEDVDDTLSVRKLSNGHTELGVHIADVSYFVPASSLTDSEARERSTTVYLADRRYDMLPAVLSADLCSLISGVDRYAMSVIWELDASCEVVDVWYGRTVIKSSYKLFYELAQQLVDGVDNEDLIENIPELHHLETKQQLCRLSELKVAVSQLMSIARQIHARRSHQGALELEGVEVQVQIDKSSEKQEIQDLIPKQPLEVHETIAECMIFANHWVAKKICQSLPSQSLLRRHPLPRQEHFASLQQCAEVHGFHVNTASNKLLAESLDACVDPNDPNVNKILRSLATQAMSNAAYFSTGSVAREDFSHYGLGLEFYTHFTSPIRRYADILVHRQLLASLCGESSPQVIPANTQLQEIAEHINHKHRAAQDSQKNSVQIFQCLFFKDKDHNDPCRVADAIIVQIRSNGVVAFVPRYGIRGAVFLRDKEGQVRFVMDTGEAEWTWGSITSTPHRLCVQSVVGTQSYNLMQHVTVRITIQESHSHPSNIKLELLHNRPHSVLTVTDPKHQKAQLIQEVTDLSEDQSRERVNLGANFDRLKAEYGQTSQEKSFYDFLQTMNDMAMISV